MILKKLPLFLALVLALGLSAKATPTSYTYTFLPDNDDPNSQGFGGSITLDVSTSLNGQLADILGVNIYGPYINTEHFDSATEYLTMLPGFSWTPTAITAMNISVLQNNQSYVFSVYDNGLYEAGMDAQACGSWVNTTAQVPDGAATGLLLVFSLALMAAIRHRSPLWRAVARR